MRAGDYVQLKNRVFPRKRKKGRIQKKKKKISPYRLTKSVISLVIDIMMALLHGYRFY